MKKIIFTSAFLLLLSPFSAYAATVGFQTRTQNITPGSDIIIAVIVETREAAGVFSGSIPVPEGAEVVSIHEGGSAVGIWSQRPSVEDGVLKFIGATPGAVFGQGELFSINMRFDEPGEYQMAFDDISITPLEDENAGLSIQAPPITITVSPEGESISERFGDPNPPNEFVPLITREENRFGGDWFVMWEAEDDVSEVAIEEIIETRNVAQLKDGTIVPKENAWMPAHSPYVLEDQSLSSYIFIRVTDMTGSSRVVTIPPSEPAISVFDITGVAALLVLVVGVLYYYNTRKHIFTEGEER